MAPGDTVMIVAAGSRHRGRKATVLSLHDHDHYGGKDGAQALLDFGHGERGAWMLGEMRLIRRAKNDPD